TSHYKHPPSFPTRRSSDLNVPFAVKNRIHAAPREGVEVYFFVGVKKSGRSLRRIGFRSHKGVAEKSTSLTLINGDENLAALDLTDRKSTRLNSSHLVISYA